MAVLMAVLTAVLMTAATIVASPAGYFVTQELGARTLGQEAQSSSQTSQQCVPEAQRQAAAGTQQHSATALHSPKMSTPSTSRRPIKGILKNKGSTTSSVAGSAQQSGGPHQEVHRKKSQKWDEFNILATYRPESRDYDFMKMSEPSTPQFGLQNYGESTESEATVLDSLTKRLAAIHISDSNYPEREPELDGAHSSKIYLDRQEKHWQFEMKRKLHYSEGKNIKLAQQLISRDLLHDYEDEDEDNKNEESHDKTTTQEEAEQGVTSDKGLQTQSCCCHGDEDKDK